MWLFQTSSALVIPAASHLLSVLTNPSPLKPFPRLISFFSSCYLCSAILLPLSSPSQWPLSGGWLLKALKDLKLGPANETAHDAVFLGLCFLTKYGIFLQFQLSTWKLLKFIFLFSKCNFIGHMYDTVLIQSFLSVHMWYFHFVAIVNRAAGSGHCSIESFQSIYPGVV